MKNNHDGLLILKLIKKVVTILFKNQFISFYFEKNKGGVLKLNINRGFGYLVM
jgi:hypothetical protein